MGRVIEFQHPCLINFRDFGGYVTEDGKYVKTGIFYRSGALGYFTIMEDQQLFLSLGINTVIDLRSNKERRRLKDIQIGEENRIEISAMIDDHGNDIDFSPKYMLKLSQLFQMKKHDSFLDYYCITHYSRLFFNNEAFKEILNQMLEHQVPLLIHCSAGKDRTGIAVALILLLLGVDRETIMEDYLLTNMCRQSLIDEFVYQNRFLIKLFPKIQTLCILSRGVLKESLETCFSILDEKYNDIQTFFEQEYGLSPSMIELLRDMYLE